MHAGADLLLCDREAFFFCECQKCGALCFEPFCRVCLVKKPMRRLLPEKSGAFPLIPESTHPEHSAWWGFFFLVQIVGFWWLLLCWWMGWS